MVYRKLLILFCSFHLLSNLGLARELELSEEETKYQTVLRWYGEGEPIGLEGLKGYYSGRCFVERKAVALGAGICREGAKNGPAFPSNEEKIGIALSSWPSDFDGVNCPGASYRDWGRTSPFKVVPTLNWLFDIEPNRRNDWRFSIVKNNDLLIMKVTNLIRQNLTGKFGLNGVYSKGEAIYACYFYKREREG